MDLQEAVEFLKTRVNTPDKDKYKKLVRAMKYLLENKNLDLKIEADNTHVLKW